MSLCLIIYLRIYFEDHKIYLNLCNSYDVMFWHLRFYMFIGVFVFLIHMACITCRVLLFGSLAIIFAPSLSIM